MYMLIWTVSPNNNQWMLFETMAEADKERKRLDIRTSAVIPVSKRAEANLTHLSSTFAVFTGSCSAAQMIQQHDPQRPG